MDGNNSLKRVPRSTHNKDNNGKTIPVYVDRHDPRSPTSGLYLPETIVNTFKNEVKKHITSQDPNPKTVQEGDPVDGVDEQTLCTEHWTNLADETSKKMWGIFHETGIFTAVCRHGVMLLFCDMICSGELAKYPLAIIDRLVSELGPNLMIGYDIGCGFLTTANRSPMVGPKIKENNICFCVGSFHGHAHNRLCQIDWHPLYVEGCGLEDFETCEQVFSQSNSLAGSTRHASAFHHHQSIINYFSRWNGDKYADLSTFILNNYKQALQLLRDLPAQLETTQTSLGISSANVFREWLREEKEYLVKLKKQPPSSNLHIDYVKVLMKLQEVEKKHQLVSQQWLNTPTEVMYPMESLSTNRSQMLDMLLTLQKTVADLETKLEIVIPWTPSSPEWERTNEIIIHQEYCEAVDKLEGLVVSRLFELTKMNQSGIGVKLRNHISKALKTRSAAIRNAVKAYNTVAGKLQPPHPVLDIRSVLAYVFVGQFDLLRDSRLNIQIWPWTRAAEREASVMYWKLERAREEVMHLNVEIRRLLTYLKDEDTVLQNLHSCLKTSNPLLAYQVASKLQYLRNINQVHSHRLRLLFSWKDYSGWRIPGVCKGSVSTSVNEEFSGERSHWDNGIEGSNFDFINEDEDVCIESDNEERGGVVDTAIHCICTSD